MSEEFEQVPVTLDNCADEPIHIPGSVQPHGILFAFEGGALLCAWSANAEQELGFAPQRGCALEAMPLPANETFDVEAKTSGRLALPAD